MAAQPGRKRRDYPSGVSYSMFVDRKFHPFVLMPPGLGSSFRATWEILDAGSGGSRHASDPGVGLCRCGWAFNSLCGHIRRRRRSEQQHDGCWSIPKGSCRGGHFGGCRYLSICSSPKEHNNFRQFRRGRRKCHYELHRRLDHCR